MCLVGFEFPANEFSLFSLKSDGDIEDDDATAEAMAWSYELQLEGQSKSHTTVSARLASVP